MGRELHIGVVGLGNRGADNVRNICAWENIKIDIVCDLYEDRVKAIADHIEAKRGYRPKETVRYEDILAEESVEAVMIFTSWEAHIPQAIAAMKAGKWVGMEVGGAFSIQSCWDLVHTYEETHTPIMMLENCCFGKRELMIANMARRGVLGKIVHCEGGYRHDLRDEVAEGVSRRHYRLNQYLNRNTHSYPTHDFGPIAKILGINRGNRAVSLVSVATKSFGIEEYIQNKRPDLTHLQGVDFAQGDVVTTIITCAGGQTVTLTLDTSLPRHYSRDFCVQGTLGMYDERSDSFCIDSRDPYVPGKRIKHNYINKVCGNAAEYEDAYLSPKWRPENAHKVKGGHGGLDGFSFSAFFDCLERRDPNFPIDVYDAATWMAITALSEQSIAHNGAPQDFPDFTNGAWISRPPVDCDDFTQCIDEQEAKLYSKEEKGPLKDISDPLS